MSMTVYLAAWLAYLVAAAVLYRVFLRHHINDWFPNSARVTRLLLLVVLFSPALMSEQGNFYVAPSLMTLMFQILMKSPAGMLKAILPWLLFGGIVLWLDARMQRARNPHDEHETRM